MYTFSNFSISKLEDLQLQIHAKRDRCLAIERRVQALREAIPYMTDVDLFTAGTELAELRKEMAEHQMYIHAAQEQINKMHKPAMVI